MARPLHLVSMVALLLLRRRVPVLVYCMSLLRRLVVRRLLRTIRPHARTLAICALALLLTIPLPLHLTIHPALAPSPARAQVTATTPLLPAPWS
jgi:hypothetical protein